MKYQMLKRDLFLNNPPYAQCISSDFGMGAGIALEFNKRFDMKNELIRRYPSGYGIGAIKHNGVYNLVIKEKVYHKPTYEDLKIALCCMRDQMVLNGDKRISMKILF